MTLNDMKPSEPELAYCTAAERELLDKLATNDNAEELRAQVLLARIPAELREQLIQAMLASDVAYRWEEALWAKIRGIRGSGRLGQRLHRQTLEKWGGALWEEAQARGLSERQYGEDVSTPDISKRPERP